MRVFNFSVDDEIYREVKIDAATEGKTVKDYLTNVILFYLENKTATKNSL